MLSKVTEVKNHVNICYFKDVRKIDLGSLKSVGQWFNIYGNKGLREIILTNSLIFCKVTVQAEAQDISGLNFSKFIFIIPSKNKLLNKKRGTFYKSLSLNNLPKSPSPEPTYSLRLEDRH